MRDTVWDCKVQKMTLPDGTPKGLKRVLQERGVDCSELNADKVREILSKHKDFMEQKTILEEKVEQRGHICLFFPKFHCELNPIECNWCHSKKEARKYANGSIVRLRQIVPSALDSVSIELVEKFFRTCRDYETVYQGGYTGRNVEDIMKVYKSHRRVFSTNS